MPASKTLAPEVVAYVEDAVEVARAIDPELVSVMVFGSSTTGTFSRGRSDVDMLIIVSNAASKTARRELGLRLRTLEKQHGIGDWQTAGVTASARVADALGGLGLSFFVVRQRDLLSGDPRRVFGLPPLIGRLFSDRIVLTNILRSSVTVWGEDLLDEVSLPAIDRFDVAKSWFSLTLLAVASLVTYPVTENSTRYAIIHLKGSMQNYYLCCTGRAGSFEGALALARAHFGELAIFTELLRRRADGRKSLGFVLRAIGGIGRLYWRLLVTARFPVELAPTARI